MEIIVFALVGVFAGLSAGFFGVGGGLITVPAMIFLLPHFVGIEADIFHIAIATSLAAIIPTALMSSYVHHKKGAILWSVIWKLAPGIFIGSVIGVLVALVLSQHVLKMIFGIFLLIVALRMLKNSSSHAQKNVLTPLLNPVMGLVIGAVSSLMGVGGGTMTVPYLMYKGVRIHNAIACSAALGLPIAIAATISFYLIEMFADSEANGYIHWPALVGISLASVIFAPIAAKIVHYLPVKLLKKIFSLFLVIVALNVIFVALK